MEERPTVRRVDANILKSNRGHPKRGGPTSRGMGEVLITPRGKNVTCYKIFTQKASDLD